MPPRRRSHGEGAVYRRGTDGRWVDGLGLGWADDRRAADRSYEPSRGSYRSPDTAWASPCGGGPASRKSLAGRTGQGWDGRSLSPDTR